MRWVFSTSKVRAIGLFGKDRFAAGLNAHWIERVPSGLVGSDGLFEFIFPRAHELSDIGLGLREGLLSPLNLGFMVLQFAQVLGRWDRDDRLGVAGFPLKRSAFCDVVEIGKE